MQSTESSTQGVPLGLMKPLRPVHFVPDYKVDSFVKSNFPKQAKLVQLGKREKPISEKLQKKNFKVGDCVNFHDSKLGKCHLPCCIVRMFSDRCLLCCRKGVLTTDYAKKWLMAVSGDVSISVENW